uniref:Uncharacterized protein n=1 Tax=Vitrella brassicaformis TaxID=1169539 RepID=A0A7S1P010_9ALVE|mmetsp:Transcript_23196/g.57383  ORF Transcript_23196/g.57383 Transcript_23196/m.57383 type:complete len:191 (+) Transcript_23196:98-670(+)
MMMSRLQVALLLSVGVGLCLCVDMSHSHADIITGETISNCKDLWPESAGDLTVCWSDCAKDIQSVKCPSLITDWRHTFVKSSFRTDTQGCPAEMRRYVCLPETKLGAECSSRPKKSMAPGDQCYTECNEGSCDETLLKEGERFDFTKITKVDACDVGYRLLCHVREHPVLPAAKRRVIRSKGPSKSTIEA